jgi:hypothetical protein
MVERWKECNLIIQIAKMFIDIRGLKDRIQIKNMLKWY